MYKERNKEKMEKFMVFNKAHNHFSIPDLMREFAKSNQYVYSVSPFGTGLIDMKGKLYEFDHFEKEPADGGENITVYLALH